MPFRSRSSGREAAGSLLALRIATRVKAPIAGLALMFAAVTATCAAGPAQLPAGAAACVKAPTTACVTDIGLAIARRVPSRDRGDGASLSRVVEDEENAARQAGLLAKLEADFRVPRPVLDDLRFTVAVARAAEDVRSGALAQGLDRLKPFARAAHDPLAGRRELIRRLVAIGAPDAAIPVYRATVPLEDSGAGQKRSEAPKSLAATLIGAFLSCACGPDPRPYFAEITDPQERADASAGVFGLTGDLDTFMTLLQTQQARAPATSPGYAWYEFLIAAAATQSEAVIVTAAARLGENAHVENVPSIMRKLGDRGLAAARDALMARLGPDDHAMALAAVSRPDPAQILAALTAIADEQKRYAVTSLVLQQLASGASVQAAIDVFEQSALAGNPASPHAVPYRDVPDVLMRALLAARRFDFADRLIAAVDSSSRERLKARRRAIEACDLHRDPAVAAVERNVKPAFPPPCDPRAWWPVAADRKDWAGALTAILSLDLYDEGDRDPELRQDTTLFDLADRMTEQ